MSIQTNNELGNIVIKKEVLARIVGNVATTSCYGVVGMAYKNKKDGLVNLLKGDKITKGINISFEEEKMVAEICVILEYGVNIQAVSDIIINNVKYNVEDLTGVKVGKVIVIIEGIRVDK